MHAEAPRLLSKLQQHPHTHRHMDANACTLKNTFQRCFTHEIMLQLLVDICYFHKKFVYLDVGKYELEMLLFQTLDVARSGRRHRWMLG